MVIAHSVEEKEGTRQDGMPQLKFEKEILVSSCITSLKQIATNVFIFKYSVLQIEEQLRIKGGNSVKTFSFQEYRYLSFRLSKFSLSVECSSTTYMYILTRIIYYMYVF